MSGPIFTPEDIEERRTAFNELWRREFADEVMLFRTMYHGRIHDMLKTAFYKGTNWERRKHEPTSVGGDW